MKVENIVATLVANYNNPQRRMRTLFLLGPSGVGKSDTIREAAEQLSSQYGCAFPVLDLRLSQMEPPDFGGVPSVLPAGRDHQCTARHAGGGVSGCA